MLQKIRDNSQGVIAKVIIGLIIAVFALFGAESIIGGFMTTPPAAEVNGEEISEQQLLNSTQNLLASIGGNPESFDQGLIEQIALNQLVEETLLRQAALDARMRVSDGRIDRAIIESPQFQIDGVFSSDLAVRTIASQALNVPLYRQQLRSNMLMSQLANAYTSSNFITDTELQTIAELRLQSRGFRFLSMTIGTRTLGVAISDAEISSYYQANQEAFTVAESVQLDYVLLDKAQLSDAIEVNDAEVLAAYERERDAAVAATERRASHILFEVGPSLTLDAAQAQALAAKQRLDAGEDFAEVASELSNDLASAELGGDIGYSDGTAFPQAMEEALLTMAVGDVSEPIATEFGVHLVMLTESDDNSYPAFEEVSERIIVNMKNAEVEQLFAARLETLSNMAFESPDIATISTALDLPVLNSELITRSGGQGLFSNPNVITEAFSEDVLLNDHNSSVIELNDAQAMVMRKSNHNEAFVRPITEVQGEIAVLIRTAMERAKVQELGNELLAALKAGNAVDEQLLENELEWFTETAVTRTSSTVNSDIIASVFAMQKPADGAPTYSGSTLGNGTYVLIELMSVNPGAVSELTMEDRSAIVESLLNDKGNAEFGATINNLKGSASITTRQIGQEF